MEMNPLKKKKKKIFQLFLMKEVRDAKQKEKSVVGKNVKLIDLKTSRLVLTGVS